MLCRDGPAAGPGCFYPERIDTGMPPDRTLLIGSATPEVLALGVALDAELLALPELGATADPGWSWADALEIWRGSAGEGARRERIVVAVWPQAVASGTLLDSGEEDWTARAEAPLACWFAALGRAVLQAADGAAIVALVESPAPLDSAEHAPEVAVAEGVVALVRSLARSEGARGVRVNAVTTPLRLSPAQPVAPQPALASFPGRLGQEVAGAVRSLLAADACGLTGTVLHADCGRSW